MKQWVNESVLDGESWFTIRHYIHNIYIYIYVTEMVAQETISNTKNVVLWLLFLHHKNIHLDPIYQGLWSKWL